jgi:hypothetical protein
VVYRMTIRANPRLLFIPLVSLVLVGIAVACFAVSAILGVVALLVAGYIGYALLRFVSKQLRCTVEVLDEGISLDLYGEEKIHMGWEEMSHMGVAADRKRRRVLFFYREDIDKLLIVPDEVEGFDDLLVDARSRSRTRGGMIELSLREGETVKDELRRIVGAAPDEEEATPPQP